MSWTRRKSTDDLFSWERSACIVYQSTQTDTHKTPSKCTLFPPQIISQQLTPPTKNNPEIPSKMQAFQSAQRVLRAFSPREKGEKYTVNKEVFYKGFTAIGRSGTDGITGTEICYRAVQKTALRLYSGTITGRPEAETQRIRLQHRPVYVWFDPAGYPGIAGTGREHNGGGLTIQLRFLFGSCDFSDVLLFFSGGGFRWCRLFFCYPFHFLGSLLLKIRE